MKKMILVSALLHFFISSPVIATETTESMKLRAACQYLLKEQIVKAEELLRNPKTAQEKTRPRPGVTFHRNRAVTYPILFLIPAIYICYTTYH